MMGPPFPTRYFGSIQALVFLLCDSCFMCASTSIEQACIMLKNVLSVQKNAINKSQNRIASCIQHGYETRSFVHTCLWLRSGQALLRETGISPRYRRRQRGLPGNTIHSPGSETSIIFDKGHTYAQPGSIDRPILAVSNMRIPHIQQALIELGILISITV
jgi:hypothetical protein